MYWALVIIALAASDGGRAINTDLRFNSRELCEQAKDALLQNDWKAQWSPRAVCLPIDRK